MSSADETIPEDSSGTRGSLKRRLAHGSLWLLGGRLGGAVAALALNVFLARSLPPSSVGAYFIIANVIGIATTFAQLGLRQSVVRLVAESVGLGDRGRTRAVIGVIYRLGAAGALAAAIIVAATGHLLSIHAFHSTLVASVVTISVLWLVFNVFQTLLSDTFRGFQDFKGSGIFEVLLVNILLAAGVLAVWKIGGHVDLRQVMWLTFGTTAVTVVLAALRLFPRIASLPKTGHVSPAEVMNVAWPLLVFNLAVFLLGSGVDVLVLGAFRSARQVALYGAAVRLIVLTQTPLYILGAVMSPVIAQLHVQGRKQELERLLRSTATLTAVPSLLAVGVCIFAGGPVLRIVYGSYYAKGASVLAVLALGQFVSVLTGACAVVLMMTGWQRTAMWVNVGTGLLSVAGDVVLAKHFGAIGVAIATAGAVALQNLLMVVHARRKLGFWTAVESPLTALAWLRQPTTQ